MKLTKKEIKRYYEAMGIQRSDLVSTDELRLSELPRDAGLRAAEETALSELLQTWNRLDDLAKIDSAFALERRVLHTPDPGPLKRVAAWAAYLALGRIQGCEDRRNAMERAARGEASVPILRADRPVRRTATRLSGASMAMVGQDVASVPPPVAPPPMIGAE